MTGRPSFQGVLHVSIFAICSRMSCLARTFGSEHDIPEEAQVASSVGSVALAECANSCTNLKGPDCVIAGTWLGPPNACLQLLPEAGARKLDRDKARCTMYVSSSPPLR